MRKCRGSGRRETLAPKYRGCGVRGCGVRANGIGGSCELTARGDPTAERSGGTPLAKTSLALTDVRRKCHPEQPENRRRRRSRRKPTQPAEMGMETEVGERELCARRNCAEWRRI